MKKILFISILVVLCSFLYANDSFKYQAIIRTADGEVIVNQDVQMRISIIQHNIRELPIYEETHFVRTNEYGLINIYIGDGVATIGSFKDINWSYDSFLQTEVDIEGGTNFQVMGITELSSVPRALYAERAGNVSENSFGLWVTDFGAVGDLEYDDTEAFQATIDSAMIIGAKVLIPTGTYKITQPLVIPNGIVLEGVGVGGEPLETPYNGTSIYYYGFDFCMSLVGHDAGIKNLSIVSRSNQARGGVKVFADGNTVESIKISNVLVSGFTKGVGLCLFAQNRGGIYYASIYDLRVRHAQTGIEIFQDQTSSINSNSFFHGVVSGGGFKQMLKVEGGNNNVFYSTIFEGPEAKNGVILVNSGEIQCQNIRIECTEQDPTHPIINFKKDTKNSHISGTFAGGLILNRGDNIIEMRSGKAIGFHLPQGNQLDNATFHGFQNLQLPNWAINGTTSKIVVKKPTLTPQHNVLQLIIPAGETVTLSPSSLKSEANLTAYQQVNFGYFVKTDKANTVCTTINSTDGLLSSQHHNGNNQWQFVGMNAPIDPKNGIKPNLHIQNTTGEEIKVQVTAPTLSFGASTPSIAPKAFTSAGGTINGLVSQTMTQIDRIPNDGFLEIAESNFIEMIATGTIYRINYSAESRFPKGTLLTILFNQNGTTLKSNPYLKLLNDFNAIPNSSIQLMSLGNGVWQEVNRNL